MTRSPSRWMLGVFVGLAGGVIAATAPSCSLNSASSGTDGYTTGSGYATGSGVGGDASVVSPDGDPPPTRLNYAQYCGFGPCVPGPKGDATACQVAQTSGTGAGTSGSSGAGGSGSSGTGGSGSTGATGSGATGSSGSGGTSALDCQITPMGDLPESVCAAVGTGAVKAPCQSASDCGPGLGCATDGSQPLVALCRPYCCGDFEDCPVETYCAKEPMAENPSRPIPVCMGVTPCQLLTKGACALNKTCAIVRADGTTSCIDTGNGQFCEACPCAAGFTCSATGVCQKLCLTNMQSNECGLGKCQGGSNNLPSGIGLCVGGEADCSHAP